MILCTIIIVIIVIIIIIIIIIIIRAFLFSGSEYGTVHIWEASRETDSNYVNKQQSGFPIRWGTQKGFCAKYFKTAFGILEHYKHLIMHQ